MKLKTKQIAKLVFLFIVFNEIVDVVVHPIKEAIKRSLSIDLGNGNCKWTISEDANQTNTLFSTLIAAYPGSGKRIAYMQLEGLTGLKTGDDFYLAEGRSAEAKKYAFMKSSYPQHEGIWSWGNRMHQSILIVRNPRHAIVSYHNILSEINYAHTWQEAYEHKDEVYTRRPSLEQWIIWRDERCLEEIYWYGWFIDYWMEGGLLRDIYSHNLTTVSHFETQIIPHAYKMQDILAMQSAIPLDIEPNYDYHCGIGKDMEDCKPVAIVSFEKLLNVDTGPTEASKFAKAVEGKPGINVIAEQARACIWEELVIRGKGIRTMKNRDGNGPSHDTFAFTVDQFQVMLQELRRLTEKYSSNGWIGNEVAEDLVGNLNIYIDEIQAEMNALLEVQRR